ncbi:class I SAM-dependent methyltransferase [Botrimarina sp.]|uniref:class I SAM-dependent methyltransferase n=1 Tax=Botrimarina sp. TaxID=2795802 RepID=UPI0032EFBDD1
MSLPEWRLPAGVPRGVWDYTRSGQIAERYDAYHGDNPLFGFEAGVLRAAFGPAPPDRAGVVADLGCGSGRALVPLVRQGWRGLAIDLSPAMLDVVRRKAQAEGLPIDCVEANLVELTADLVPDQAADHAMCLFSTLGMIRGSENRRAALGHMRRILKPGGRLVLHAHNFWNNLRDPGGPGWALRSLARGAVGRGGYETGDRTFPYRGVPNFFVHAYRARELRADLRWANFRVARWVPLGAAIDPARRHALPRPWLLPSLRATGWLVVCRREG